MLREPCSTAEPPSPWAEHSHQFLWLPLMEAAGRETLAAQLHGRTLAPSTPSPIKPPLHPAVLQGHWLPKATWEHLRCQPPVMVLCPGDMHPPCRTGTGDGSRQHCPRPWHSPLLPTRERHHGPKNKNKLRGNSCKTSDDSSSITLMLPATKSHSQRPQALLLPSWKDLQAPH